MTALGPVHRQTTHDIVRELEARAKALRAVAPKSTHVPFPDPEGEDRDERRAIEWDFTR